VPRQPLSSNLSARYPFSTILLSDVSRGNYTFHWDFFEDFAVNVSTKGWVGFGLSPKKGMVGSELVIGWVSGGTSFFQVVISFITANTTFLWFSFFIIKFIK